MKSAAWIASALLVAGCAGPRPDAPASTVVTPPAQWRDVVSSPDASAVSSTWWTGFGDPVLDALVDRALARNDDLAIAAERVIQARAQFRETAADRWPLVTASGGIVRERELNPFGVPVKQTAREAELRVSYEVDLFGRIANATEAQRATLFATQAARDTVRLAVASSTVTGYLQLRSLDARLLTLQDTVKARAESARVIGHQARSGYATQLELAQAEAELHATAQQIPVIQLAIRKQENALSVLVGDPPGPIARGLDLDSIILQTVPPQLPAAVLRQRPDIAQAEQQIVAADRTLDVARANFMPRISLSYVPGAVNSTLIDGPYGVFSLGGSILAPIFEGGRLRAAADAAASARDQAAFNYRKVALTSFREVEDALASVQRSDEQEREQVQQTDALLKAQKFANGRYRAGYSSYLETLDAERGVLAVQLSRLQTRSDRLAAAVSLYQSLGGGWDRSSLGSDPAGVEPR